MSYNISKNINALANEDIVPYFLKGIDVYRQIKPLQEDFANAIESQDYTKANEISDQMIQTIQEFHTLFYFRVSTIKLGVIDWRAAETLQKHMRSLYTILMDVQKSAKSVDLNNFVKHTDRAYHQMFKILECAKEYAEEGIPIPRHYIKNERTKGSAVLPSAERIKGKDVDPEVKKQVVYIKKKMAKVYKQRDRLANWKEWTKHHRRQELNEEEHIEIPKTDNIKELEDYIKEFEGEM